MQLKKSADALCTSFLRTLVKMMLFSFILARRSIFVLKQTVCFRLSLLPLMANFHFNCVLQGRAREKHGLESSSCRTDSMRNRSLNQLLYLPVFIFSAVK